ncbi:AAA family ATPase [Candidatus Tisiphia endosymbiont of Nemotelus uliginosus]|uniref:AAA family ATPase n=1 Tax=Candidatus Tisiphia endosymbiont of Nemotelus uliginosus TaxID=3077926 RepID=UPI0035C89F15
MGIVEELQHRGQHNLSIDESAIDKLSIREKLIASAVKVGIAVQEVVNDKLGLKYELIARQSEPLTKKQRKAVMEILNGKDISVLEGYPGSGKTFVMREIVRQYRKAGYRVIGTSPSSSAAQVLASATGIQSKNIALWRKDWQEAKGQKFELALRSDYYTEGEYQHQERVESSFSQYCNNIGIDDSTELNNKTILIIDEASMIELASMDYLLTEVSRFGAKAIIVGDNNQFAAVGMTGAFRKVCVMSCVSRLTEVMRHKHPDLQVRKMQREATKLMGLYKMNEALKIFQQLGAFNIHDNELATKDALVADYISEYVVQASHLNRDDLASIRSVVIGAYTNVAVNYFNIEVREKLKQAGILKGLGANFKSGAERVELLRGEQIVFTSNKAEYKGFNEVLNGEVATVIDFNEPDKFGHGIVKLLVHKADGSKKIIKIDTANSKYPVRFKHGYAVTGYKLQGETVDYMKVYYESVIGYEAFNVLMSRYKYEVKLYSAKDVLEDIVYKRLEEDVATVRSQFTIEAYRKLNKLKVEVPSWYIGLSLGVSKRVDNNLALNYRQLDKLSPNEQVIKSYLEARRVVLDLRGKIQEWQEHQETPIKLTRLYAAVSKRANVKMKNAREITIDPYGLILEFLHQLNTARKLLGESATEEEIRAYVRSASVVKTTKAELTNTFASTSINDRTLWSELSRTEQNQYILPHLLEDDLQQLENIYEQLEESKETLKKHALVICNNYHGSSSSGGAEEANNKDYVTMGDRIIQLNLNYQTILRHAGYSTDKYFFKNINQGATLVASSCWGEIMKICHGLHSRKHDKIDALNIFTTNLAALNEFISETKQLLIEKTALLQATKVEQQQIKKELTEITNYREKLFPEFISRIYKTPVSQILEKWQDLLEEGKHEQLADAISKLKHNPKLLGDLKGVGFGKMFAINQSRKDAISNLAVIARRFKDYEQGAVKVQELQNTLLARNYESVLANLSAEIVLLTESLPNKYEQSFLAQVSLLQQESKLTIENLAIIIKEDELQGLIYEYYNYINDAELARSVSSANIEAEDQKNTNTVKIEESSTREGKFIDRTNKYRGNYSTNTTKNKRLDFNEVSSQLTEYNYRCIFEHYARRINSDGKSFKRSGAEISLGSLSMNLRKGVWIRHSTGEGGNIFSFVQQALNCGKLEALEQVALMAGISAKGNDYHANNYHNDNYQNNVPQLKIVGQENTQAGAIINEWCTQPYVPASAVKFDPNVHLAWLLKSNIIDGIYYYRNKEKQLIGLTVRLVSTQDGSKQVLPVSYCKNESLHKEAWRLKGFSDNGYKPIYHLEKLADDSRTILIVEGEKTCDKAQELLPDYLVLSWLGGSNGSAKANWQQLRGREVVIWPDHDEAGVKAARTIGQMINEANGYIGLVAIIDPSRLEFYGTIHESILPEKWDLADKLPEGLNTENLKEAIIHCQQQNSSLSYSQSIAASLKQLLTQPQILAIGERIFWQARTIGALLQVEQIRQEVAAEVSWQEKLSSPEAKYYMKYAENTGKGGSPHEFLRLQDSLYRDTLVAIAVSSRIKDKESLGLPGLIRELQGEYE